MKAKYNFFGRRIGNGKGAKINPSY